MNRCPSPLSPSVSVSPSPHAHSLPLPALLTVPSLRHSSSLGQATIPQPAFSHGYNRNLPSKAPQVLVHLQGPWAALSLLCPLYRRLRPGQRRHLPKAHIAWLPSWD